MDFDRIKFDEKGLVPAIVQDYYSKQVLTVAYMNREALEITVNEGYTCFFSRSRQELWRKGETSGNRQKVVSITSDCDNDALVVELRPCGIHAESQSPAGKDRIKLHEDVVIGGKDTGMAGGPLRQGGQDGLDFRGFRAFQLADLIVEADDGRRLHKDRAAGGRTVMDDAGHIALAAGLHRHTPAAVARGDDGIMQIIAGRGIQELRQLRMDAVTGGADAAAD